MRVIHLRFLLFFLLTNGFFFTNAQDIVKKKFNNNTALCAGIEVGSKGVKMSVLEIGKNAQTNGGFTIIKDSSINTDFISFTPPTFSATLAGLCKLYKTATSEYNISPKLIYTVVSSGVKIQAEKENKTSWINNLIDSFRIKIKEPKRTVTVVDVVQEARLSHLGIVPESRRYKTFLIDIGSGNTKGGFFPYGNDTDFKLFQLSWGTKSTANAAEKLLENEKTVAQFNRQLYKVLLGAENSEIIYAVNESGAYPLSDNVAFSGGIAWAVATLMYPELIGNSVVPVSFEEVIKFKDRIFADYSSLSDVALTKNINDNNPEKNAIAKEVKRVHSVFDQKSLMSGAGLMVKIMRQFQSIYEGKQFYLVKNGQVGWISAFVDQSVEK